MAAGYQRSCPQSQSDWKDRWRDKEICSLATAEEKGKLGKRIKELIFNGFISVAFIRKCGDLQGLLVPVFKSSTREAEATEARPVISSKTKRAI